MLNFAFELNLIGVDPLDFEPYWHCLGDIQEDTCKYFSLAGTALASRRRIFVNIYP